MRLKNVFLLLCLRMPCYLYCSSTSLSSRCRLSLCLHLSIVLLQIFAKLRECFVSVRYGVLERFVHLCVRLIESTGLENWIPTAIFTNNSSKRINNVCNQHTLHQHDMYSSFALFTQNPECLVLARFCQLSSQQMLLVCVPDLCCNRIYTVHRPTCPRTPSACCLVLRALTFPETTAPKRCRRQYILNMPGKRKDKHLDINARKTVQSIETERGIIDLSPKMSENDTLKAQNDTYQHRAFYNIGSYFTFPETNFFRFALQLRKINLLTPKLHWKCASQNSNNLACK